MACKGAQCRALSWPPARGHPVGAGVAGTAWHSLARLPNGGLSALPRCQGTFQGCHLLTG